MGDGEPAVYSRGLEKRYGKTQVLHGIDLSIPRGAIYGVLGPSGAGKTTLVNCIGMVARPTGGTLKLFGEDTRGRPPRLRARIGYMPQKAALYEELSARFNIEFFSRGSSRERVDHLIDMLGLSGRGDDAVTGFSGGMKQRVSLAAALAPEPELLLLDEPTAGIDPVLRLRFWEEFRRLRDAGTTLLVSTHQIDEATNCDKLLIIREGRVLVESPPEALLARGGARVRVELANGEIVSERLEEPEIDLPRWLAAHGLDNIAKLSVRVDNLEDILVTMIQEADRGE